MINKQKSGTVIKLRPQQFMFVHSEQCTQYVQHLLSHTSLASLQFPKSKNPCYIYVIHDVYCLCYRQHCETTTSENPPAKKPSRARPLSLMPLNFDPRLETRANVKNTDINVLNSFFLPRPMRVDLVRPKNQNTERGKYYCD